MWGTDFTADIFLVRERYNNLSHLEEEIEDTEKYIRSIREKILMQCASGAKYGCTDIEGNEFNPIDYVHSQVSEWFEEYDREQGRLFNLYLLREDWDEKENKFKTAKDG